MFAGRFFGLESIVGRGLHEKVRAITAGSGLSIHQLNKSRLYPGGRKKVWGKKCGINLRVNE
jgi:hypothetical protein